MRGRMAIGACGAALVGAGVVACTALLGTPDLHYEEASSQTSGDASTAETSTTVDGSTPTEECNADLANDARHCGRCNHDCRGTNCVGGLCERQSLASSLANPTTLLVTPNALYYGTYGGGGAVFELRTDAGPTAQPRAIVTGQGSVWGLALSGSTIYWVAHDGAFDDAGRTGGVWKCTLPACASPTLVRAAWYARNVAIRGNKLAYAEEGNSGTTVEPSLVVRADLDGNGVVSHEAPEPFAVALDDTHVYWTGFDATGTHRAPIGGGGSETIGPGIGTGRGYIVLDDDRVYWAYSESQNRGRVYSTPKANPNPTAPTEYGDWLENKNAFGVGVDATNVYWTNMGTFVDNGTADGEGTVMTCPKAGCGGKPPTLVAKKLFQPVQVVPSGDFVYILEWGNDGVELGSVSRVVKP